MNKITKYYKYFLMFGHISTDINQGALPAILPFLIAARDDMNYASAGTLMFAAHIVSSIAQPILGYWGDKVFRPWVISLGIALAGSGVAFIGVFQSYWGICLAAALSGLGVALFHPEGGKTANIVAGEKKGAGISIFAVGGNLGFALGPIIASSALNMWGLNGTLVFLLPAYVMAAIILILVPNLKNLAPAADEKKSVQIKAEQPDNWNAFSRISFVLVCRSIIQNGLITFIPLYWISIFMLQKDAANSKLTIFSLAGAVATVIGGRIADKYGFRRTIYISFLILAPLLLMMFQIKNDLAATLLIIPVAFVLSGPYSAMIAMAQSFLPNHIGFASGISLGLAVSIGGLFAPIIGKIGDTFGLTASMLTVTFVAFAALVLSLILPKQKEKNITR